MSNQFQHNGCNVSSRSSSKHKRLDRSSNTAILLFWISWSFLLLIVLLGILAMVYKLPTTFAGIGSLVFVGFQVGGSLYWWSSSLVLFDTFYSSIASIIVFGHASFNKYYKTYQLKEQIKKQFQKYLSPDMVEELQKDPSKLKLGGQRKRYFSIHGHMWIHSCIRTL